jgi:hypothetical protein
MASYDVQCNPLPRDEAVDVESNVEEAKKSQKPQLNQNGMEATPSASRLRAPPIRFRSQCPFARCAEWGQQHG